MRFSFFGKTLGMIRARMYHPASVKDRAMYITPPLDFATFIQTMFVAGGMMMRTLAAVERASELRGGLPLLAVAAMAAGGYWFELDQVLR